MSERAKLYPVHIACNDGDNGMMGRHAEGVSLSFGKLPSFDLAVPSVTFRHIDTQSGTAFRFSRREYAYASMSTWVGNWCWNAYYLSPMIAAKFVQDMMRDARWTHDGGLVEACDAWERQDLATFMRVWRDALWPRQPIQIVGSGGGHV